MATYETNYMEAQDWAGEEEELPARREEPSTWRSQEGEEPGARRESSSHSFDSESLPGELVIAELEPLGAVQVGWIIQDVLLEIKKIPHTGDKESLGRCG